MNKKNDNTRRLLDFLAGKGFYVVLILCVAAIGVSGYMLFFGGQGETPEEPSLGVVSPAIPSPSPSPYAYPSPSPYASPSPYTAPSPAASPAAALPSPSLPPVSAEDPAGDVIAEPDDPNTAEVFNPDPNVPADTSPVDVPAEAEPPEFVRPVAGDLSTLFSESADVWYESVREFRYHPGIDLLANEGALVGAAAPGTVREVFEDTRMGITVILDHEDGYSSVYSSLGGFGTLEAGQTVAAGDTVGAVGISSAAELALGPHLHFELHKDGVPVNPMEYLPEEE